VSKVRDTSRSLRSRRAVRTDAALGDSAADGGGPTRLGPSTLVARAGRARFPLAAPTWPGSVPRPAPDPELGVHYDTAWSRRYGVRLARAVVLDNVTRPLARILASPGLRGEEGLVDLETPVIFAANHASHVDTPLLLACLPLRFRHRTVVAAAADYFFDRRWKADDWNLVIFPEGGRSPDGWAQEFRGGAAYLASRTGRPVVPVHLDGTRHIIPKGGSTIRRTRTTVTFGTPLWPAEGEDARRFSARIEGAVATLAAESTTDWWTARKQAAAGTTPSLQGPDVAAWRRSWALAPSPDRTERIDDGGNDWPRKRS
jgi:1-acyl-sn-glycerol-3-phosphate acyltransferase